MIQPNFTILLDKRHPQGEHAAEQLAGFADLIKRPGDLHTYRVTPLSIWNAAAAGLSENDILDVLERHNRFELPVQVETGIVEWFARYGQLRLEQRGGTILLVGSDAIVLAELAAKPAIRDSLLLKDSDHAWEIRPAHRGRLKQELIRIGYPVLDLAGYHSGEELQVSTRELALRDYQQQAVELFYKEGSVHGGSGVLVLPCGAGKTVVGLAALAKLKCAALILTSNVISVKQWKQELLNKTTLRQEDIGEYAGALREVRPVTIATYQIITHRSAKQEDYVHMKLFSERNWGLIIYDEVHLLPAPVFRMTAEIQATRRMGLTATLIREDGREEDVFSLIGPKRFDLPWKTLESKGWIAALSCVEIRIPLAEACREKYCKAQPRGKQRLASENPLKLDVISELLERHVGQQILIIGQYLNQLEHLSSRLGIPMLTGSTPHDERERLFEQFRQGKLSVLIVSKVANFAVNLPDASVAIQVSGSFGSRQEEAQRTGRILRPKSGSNEARFYSLVTEGTKETEFALKRQMFMIEQGYSYELEMWGNHTEPGKAAVT
ncbi:DNA repair helicase XPB [Paenibacillus sp. GCM10012307]